MRWRSPLLVFAVVLVTVFGMVGNSFAHHDTLHDIWCDQVGYTPNECLRPYRLVIDGVEVQLEEPMIRYNSSVMLPLRDFANKVLPHATVSWDRQAWKARVATFHPFATTVEFSPLSRVGTASYGSHSVVVHWQRYRAYVPGDPLLSWPRSHTDTFYLAEPPRILGGKTYVPIRFLGEVFGYEVGYDHQTLTITMTQIQPNVMPAPSHLHLLEHIPYRLADGQFSVVPPPNGYPVTPTGLVWYMDAMRETNQVVDALIRASHTDPDTHQLRIAQHTAGAEIWQNDLGLVANITPTTVTWHFDQAGMANFVDTMKREISNQQKGAAVLVPIGAAVLTLIITRNFKLSESVQKILIPAASLGTVSSATVLYFVARDGVLEEMERCLRTAEYRNQSTIAVTFVHGRIGRCTVK